MKKIWIALTIVLVIAASALLYLKFRKSTDFEPLIKAKLQELVKDGSNGLYTLEMDKIEVDVLSSKVNVSGAKLSIDSSRLQSLDTSGMLPADIFNIKIAAINIDGINIDDVLTKKHIDLQELKLNNPLVEIFHRAQKSDTPSYDTSNLYTRIAKSLGHFSINELSITNMDFVYHNLVGKEKLTQLRKVNMNFAGILIDSVTQYDTTRFMYAKDAFIYFNDYTYRTPDSLYFVKADSLTLHASKKELKVKGLSLSPRNKEGFSKMIKQYKDRYDVHFDYAMFSDIEWYELLAGESFMAEYAELRQGGIEIYSDRNIPLSGKSKVGNYPHQLLIKLDFPVDVRKVGLKDTRVTYKEVNPKTQQTGSIFFSNMNGIISNVTNIDANIAANKMMVVDAKGLLMGEGVVAGKFTFDLTKTATGDFSIDVDLGQMDGKILNAAARPLGMFGIDDATIKKLKAHVDGNNNSATSRVLFEYDDLKITALKETDNGQLKSRGFLSFIANTFVLKKSNPKKNEKVAEEKASFKRDPNRSFFFLAWKAIMQGMLQTVK